MLPCPAVPSGFLAGFHVPSFSRILGSSSSSSSSISGSRSCCPRPQQQQQQLLLPSTPVTALCQVPASHQVATSHQVAVSGQVPVSGPDAVSCSCRSLAHPTVLLQHRMGHPSIPRLRTMCSQRLVLGLPRILPSVPPSLAPPCVPCDEGRLRATPHSSSLRPATEPFETLHLDVWGPVPRPGLERESFFSVVIDNYSHYTTVFPMAKKSETLHEQVLLSRNLGVLPLEVLELELRLCLHEALLQHSTVQHTPLAVDHRLTGPFSDEPFEPSGPYAELVGCLMYLMTCTRPDLAFPLSILARFVALGRHHPIHWTAAVRVANYLAMTSDEGLVLGGRQSVVLTGHCDSSYADDAETHRSTQGYCFSLGSGAVSWRSTRSSSVSTSTAEAEIYARSMAAHELRWLTFLLTDLGERPSSAPTLFTDNKASTLLCREPRLESRVKHINIRHLTKALPSCDHSRCCVQLCLVDTGFRLA
ncbi:unnamed protein product [Closterium sp. NIES-54]